MTTFHQQQIIAKHSECSGIRESENRARRYRKFRIKTENNTVLYLILVLCADRSAATRYNGRLTQLTPATLTLHEECLSMSNKMTYPQTNNKHKKGIFN